MPQTIYTEEEVRVITHDLEEKLLKASILLSEKVSRAEYSSGIGGFGCILKPGAESKYCFGCPSVDFCPAPGKRFPK